MTKSNNLRGLNGSDLLVCLIFLAACVSCACQGNNRLDPGAASPSSVLSVAAINGILDEHNKARIAVTPAAATMPMLKWNQALAEHAQNYIGTCPGMTHSSPASRTNVAGFSYIGENLAAGYESGRGFDSWDVNNGGAKSARSWNAEIEDYTYNKYGASGECTPGRACGHYTQNIWAATTEIGCGYKYCGSQTYKNYWICVYGSGGNYEGQYPYTQSNGTDGFPVQSLLVNNFTDGAESVFGDGVIAGAGVAGVGAPGEPVVVAGAPVVVGVGAPGAQATAVEVARTVQAKLANDSILGKLAKRMKCSLHATTLQDYACFLALKVATEDWYAARLSAPADVDLVWQQHILDTEDYEDTCKAIGVPARINIIHHNPDGGSDVDARADRRKRALKLYTASFGAPPLYSNWAEGCQQKHVPQVRDGMYIFIKTLKGETIDLKVEANDPIEVVKTKLSEVEGTPETDQRLIFSGTQLMDGRTLADYRIQRDSMLHMLLKLTGC